MNTRRQRPPEISARRTSMSGSFSAKRLSMSVCSGVINSLLTQKKRAGAHSRYDYRRLRDGTKALASRIAVAQWRVADSGPLGVATGAFAIEPVIGALGGQRAGQREWLARLAVTSQKLHRTAKTEQRIVVGGRT